MRVTRKREQDRPLVEFPGWALEIMMGLYGEEQVKSALMSEGLTVAHQRLSDQSTFGEAAPTSATAAEFDAVSSLLARVRRMRRNH